MRDIIRHLVMIACTVLLGGFLSATLVRFAPGFGTDEQQLDSRLNSASVQAIQASHGVKDSIGRFYLDYLVRAAHGDLGQSQTLGRPVRELISERLPGTVRLVGFGLMLGWALALSLALTAAAVRNPAYDLFTTLVSGATLCVPSAVLGLLFVFANGPAYLAIALIVFPRVFRYSRNLLAKSYEMPHIITARAKGIGEVRILFWHVLPVTGPQMLALTGVSVSMALGAAIPVEALCGIPGIGQLAWQAALGRDLSLLVTLTVLVTVATLLANSGSELASQVFRPREA
jgi:peptide/nickel transport system permease protein